MRLPKAFASTKPCPADARTPLCQGKCRTEVEAAAWCVRTGEGEVK